MIIPLLITAGVGLGLYLSRTKSEEQGGALPKPQDIPGISPELAASVNALLAAGVAADPAALEAAAGAIDKAAPGNAAAAQLSAQLRSVAALNRSKAAAMSGGYSNASIGYYPGWNWPYPKRARRARGFYYW